MQKPTGGARRHDVPRTDRAQASATSLLARVGRRATRAVGTRVERRVAATGTALSGAVRPFASAERALPIAVAAIVAVAALLAFLPNTPQGAVGGVQGRGTDVRIAIGGAGRQADGGDIIDAAAATAEPAHGGEARLGSPTRSFQPVELPGEVIVQPGTEEASLDGPVLDDGTLVTGYAPLTTVEDGADLIRTYKVKTGDTLASIAKRFDVSLMTLWWANKLTSKDLTKGRTLRIPPVSGLVHTVTNTETLASLAAEYKISPDAIVELNGLEDPTLVVGQVLVLPGAKGAPMPTPKPKPAVRSGGGARVAGPSHYAGGAFKWPVIGGNNYVSQYYHYGHWAIDIAADYGAKVVAAAPGRVTFAGWKSNGGGYQVWIAHGSGLYTTYNHMSAITVSVGQSVGRGQQVGRVGQSGHATGPHLHFEVWRGPIWDGGQRVNPIGYF